MTIIGCTCVRRSKLLKLYSQKPFGNVACATFYPRLSNRSRLSDDYWSKLVRERDVPAKRFLIARRLKKRIRQGTWHLNAQQLMRNTRGKTEMSCERICSMAASRHYACFYSLRNNRPADNCYKNFSRQRGNSGSRRYSMVRYLETILPSFLTTVVTARL